MTNLLKIVGGLLALLFLFSGVKFMLDPVGGPEGLGIEASGPAGFNSIRGIFGGMFLTAGVLIVLGFTMRRPDWLLAVAILMLLIALGRLVGFVFDGTPGSQEVGGFVLEIVAAAVLIAASRKLAA